MDEKIREIEERAEHRRKLNAPFKWLPDQYLAMEDIDTLLAVIKEREHEITRLRTALKEKDGEIARLREDLKLNAAMLARQCDLAREAESVAMRLRDTLEKVRLLAWEALK